MSTNTLSVVNYIKQDAVTARVNELLGKRASQFITSLTTAVNENNKLAACEPQTVLTAALTAASMGLPINQNLGFAYLIPYNNKGGSVCQFQMGYKGYIQLAQRSGFYKTINATDVREGEIADNDRLAGEIKFKWLPDSERDKAKVIGYIAYFKLLNGFEKSLYITVADIENHAKRYSQSFAKWGSGLWKTDFDAMAKKTVLKLLISKFGPMSTQMQEAVTHDQAVIDDNGNDDYIDNRAQFKVENATVDGKAIDEDKEVR